MVTVLAWLNDKLYWACSYKNQTRRVNQNQICRVNENQTCRDNQPEQIIYEPTQPRTKSREEIVQIPATTKFSSRD